MALRMGSERAVPANSSMRTLESREAIPLRVSSLEGQLPLSVLGPSLPEVLPQAFGGMPCRAAGQNEEVHISSSFPYQESKDIVVVYLLAP